MIVCILVGALAGGIASTYSAVGEMRGPDAEPMPIRIVAALILHAPIGGALGGLCGGVLGLLLGNHRQKLLTRQFLMSFTVAMVVLAAAYLVLVRPKQIEQRNQDDLERAFNSEDVGWLRVALDEGASPDSQIGEGTALYTAAKNGIGNFCGYLLSRGANANSRNAGGETPLLVALEFKHNEIAEALLERGADPRIADDNGVTPLMMAAEGAIAATTTSDNNEMIDLLVSKGADVNATALTDPYTPLMAAIGGEHVKNVEHLLSLGADPNISGQPGILPLDYARKLRRSEMIDLLIAHGARAAESFGSGTPDAGK